MKEPKTTHGRRAINLGKQAIQALNSRLKKAKDERFNPDVMPSVFPSTNGKFYWGSNFDRNVWHPIREAAGIPDTFTFHDLRHTQASLLLYSGTQNMKRQRISTRICFKVRRLKQRLNLMK